MAGLFGSEKTWGAGGAEKQNKTQSIYKEKELPRKELKGAETQAGLQWRAPKAREGKGGRGEGREQVQAQLAQHPASARRCLCQEPAFLKPWARRWGGDTASQAEGSRRAGAGKHRGEPSGSRGELPRLRWGAGRGKRRGRGGGGGQGLGEGLSQACLRVCLS